MYSRTFWIAFSANILLTTANALTFRFAEFVTFLGGSEELTGQIVSCAYVISLIWRLFLGQTIDLLGVQRIWIYSIIAYVTGAVLLMVTDDLGWQIYAGRGLVAVGIAGMFACSMSHIQTLAPPHRRTEMIAAFGTSGYLGMTVGAQIGDLIFHWYVPSPGLFDALFGALLGIGVLHTAIAVYMTHHDVVTRPETMPGIHRLLLSYWPPLVMFVAMLLGLSFAVTTIFLTRFATERGLSGIRTFFTMYAVAAFVLRLAARNWSRVTGRHKLIVWGLLAQALGFWALTFVVKEWQMIPSAVCCGFGHALIFACVVSLGAGAFPEQYRGTGTTVTLACIDLGTIITAPVLGWLIDDYGFNVMLSTVGVTMLISAVFYTIVTFRVIDSDVLPTTIPPETA